MRILAVGRDAVLVEVTSSHQAVAGCLGPGPRAGPRRRTGAETLLLDERGPAACRRDRGVVLGSVQVPPDGRPVVFLADQPTTGGYPVVAVVEEDDLWQCAQLRPGEPVELRRAARR